MTFHTYEIMLKDGRKGILRGAEASDAPALLEYLKATAAETRFLLREPEEITYTLAQEERFVREMKASEQSLMLVAVVDGRIAGTCSASPVGPVRRYAHRCSVAIALYREFWGLGLGKKMLQALLDAAAKLGYEQAELEVIDGNEPALRLYNALGFEVYGTRKRGIKYQDGTCADEILMQKIL